MSISAIGAQNSQNAENLESNGALDENPLTLKIAAVAIASFVAIGIGMVTGHGILASAVWISVSFVLWQLGSCWIELQKAESAMEHALSQAALSRQINQAAVARSELALERALDRANLSRSIQNIATELTREAY